MKLHKKGNSVCRLFMICNNLNLIMPIFHVLKGCLLIMSAAYNQMYLRILTLYLIEGPLDTFGISRIFWKIVENVFKT